jgi:hypothetical protein
MNTNTSTYTRNEVMELLGISPNTFHYLRNAYPQAFVVVHQGTGKGNPTLYDKQAIDKFHQWRNEYKKGK